MGDLEESVRLFVRSSWSKVYWYVFVAHIQGSFLIPIQELHHSWIGIRTKSILLYIRDIPRRLSIYSNISHNVGYDSEKFGGYLTIINKIIVIRSCIFLINLLHLKISFNVSMD